MREKGFCPTCNRQTNLKKESRVEPFEVRGEKIDVRVTVFVCEECGNDFYDPDSDPNDIAFREYRRKKAWTQPEEIAGLRKDYGLTQNEFAELLGWGVATLSRYENGALQGESHESVLKLLKDDRLNFIRLVQSNSSLPKNRRDELLATFEPKKSQLIFDLFSKVCADEGINEYTGFRKFDPSRLKNCILFFCKGGCLKTNLNKLLFYADFKACKERGQSLTGARYVRINYGPVVNNFNYYFASLVEDEALEMEEVEFKNGYMGEKYTGLQEPDLSAFDQGERDVLNLVKRQLSALSARDIAERSHQEQAYIKTPEKKPISFELAKELSL